MAKKILLYSFEKKKENNAPVVILYRLMNHLDDMLSTQCRLVGMVVLVLFSTSKFKFIANVYNFFFV